MEDDSGILFVEDEKKDLCSFKSVRKVHEVNKHKGKDQMMAAYCKAGWMSPEMANVNNSIINDRKFRRSIARLRVSLPHATSFNEEVTLDLKEY